MDVGQVAAGLGVVAKGAAAEGFAGGDVDLGPDGGTGISDFSQVPTISASANAAMNIGM